MDWPRTSDGAIGGIGSIIPRVKQKSGVGVEGHVHARAHHRIGAQIQMQGVLCGRVDADVQCKNQRSTSFPERPM